MARLSIIVGILAIPLGIVFIIAASVPDFGAVFVRPLCNGEFQTQSLSCITSTGTSYYEDMLGGGGVISLVAGILLLVFSLVFSLISYSFKLDRIVREGEAAEATILEMHSTGTRVNDQPMLKFRLRVQPQYGQSYEAETRRIIPHSILGSIALGMSIPVKYDPNKPEDVALDLDAFQTSFLEKSKKAQGFGMNIDEEDSLTEKLQELEKAYRLELITKEEYDKARQKILDNLA